MTSNLKTSSFGAADSYVGVLGSNAQPPAETASRHEKLLYSLTQNSTSKAESTADYSTIINEIPVPSGVGVLMGGVGNWQDGELEGCWMTVQRPNGDYINTATPPSADNLMVLLPSDAPANSVLSFIVINPEPGTWKVNIGCADGTPLFQAYASTIPVCPTGTTPAIDRMLITVKALVTTPGAWTQAPETSLATESSSWDWECDACKLVAYPTALAVAAAIAGTGAALLTAESAVVIATAGLLSVSAPVALGLLVGLATAGTMTVDFILTSLCTWAGVCDG